MNLFAAKIIFVTIFQIPDDMTVHKALVRIMTSFDFDEIASLIEENAPGIKKSLQNGKYVEFKKVVNRLYNTSAPWVYHTDPHEKMFIDFYNKVGHLYPKPTSPKPEGIFAEELALMVSKKPKYLAKRNSKGIPLKYHHWLTVHYMREEYGNATVLKLMKATSKIVNP